MVVGQNYIVNQLDTSIRFEQDGPRVPVTWFQFRVPIAEFTSRVGNITDFKSIRFMRMFVKEFKSPVVLRFAKLDLIRGEWRRYLGDLREDGE